MFENICAFAYNCVMMNIQTFREQLRGYLAGDKKITQASLSARTGVPQYAISRFLSGSDLSGRYVLPLYSLVMESTPITGTPHNGNCTHAEPTPQE